MNQTPWFLAGQRHDPELGVDFVEEPHEPLWKLAMGLWAEQGEDRESLCDDALTLYYGADDWERDAALARIAGMRSEPPGTNVIQYCVDAKTAVIVKNKVRPLFVTDKGSTELQEKARAMQRAVEGQFAESGLYGDLGIDLCFDGNVWDAGVLKIVPDYANMRILFERCFPWELLVGKRDSRLGKPRQLFHPQLVDRAVLEAFFAEDEEAVDAIRNAKNASERNSEAADHEANEVSDQIIVVEAWHLPSGRVDLEDRKSFGYHEGDDGEEFKPYEDPGHDGRRAIVIDGHTLLFEPWPFDYFPFAFFKPLRRRKGFWSRGIPEILAGSQLAINRMNQRVDGIMNLHARPIIYLWKQAKVNKAKINNDYGTILEGNSPAGQALQYLTPQSVPAEYMARIDKIITWAEKQVGLSELTINAAKPPGIDHAPGLQFLADTESIRHTPAFRSWEQMHLDAAKITVDCFRLLSSHAKRSSKSFEIVLGDSKDLKRIDWEDIDLPRSKYHLRLHPTNLLAKTPAALISQAITLFEKGLFTREQVLQMLDAPDVAAVTGDMVAARENIERQLEAILKGEDPELHGPDTFMDLEMAKVMTRERINRLSADGEPDENIDLLRQFFADLVEFQRGEVAAEVNAQQGVPPPGGPGGGMPAPQPVPPGAPAPEPANVAA